MRLTLEHRCEKASELVKNNGAAVMWCHLNDEGDYLEKITPDAVQVSGSDSDDKKEEILKNFSDGKIRVLITKPKIAGFGLNWQHCSHITFFPSHSFEQYYQSVRRCWRFGQTKPVTVDIITTQGGESVLKNMQKKSSAADKMFTELVKYMNDSIKIEIDRKYTQKVEVPAWLSQSKKSMINTLSI
jgi:superfamily II DNA/RNA helicase